MAKSDTVELDDELDFDDELNFDFGDMGMEDDTEDDSRKPVERAARKAFQHTLEGSKRQLIDPKFIEGFVKGAMPKEYSEAPYGLNDSAYDQVKALAGTATELYNDAVREIKPEVNKVFNQVYKLVPANQQRVRGYLDKLKEIAGFDDERADSGWSAGNAEDREIKGELSRIFDVQVEQQAQQRAEDQAEGLIQTNIEQRRYETDAAQLQGIHGALGRLVSYNDRVNAAYQRKSLELQYRSYFVQAGIAKRLNEWFGIAKAQGEAIVKNTALPDYVKQRDSERFKQLTQSKFFDQLHLGLFGNTSGIQRGIDKIKKSVKGNIADFVSTIGQVSSMGDQAGEMMAQAAEMQAALGGGQESQQSALNKGIDMGTEFGGDLAGGWLMETGGKRFAKMIKERIAKPGSKTHDLILKGAKYGTDIPATLRELTRTGFLKPTEAEEKAEGRLARVTGGMKEAAKGLINIFTDDTDLAIDKGEGLADLSKPAVYDTITKRSIDQVIPGYLSRILREVTIIRTGDDSIDLVEYDFQQGKFLDRRFLQKSIKDIMTDTIVGPGLKNRFGDVEKTLDLQSYSPAAQTALRNAMVDIVTAKDAGIIDSRTFMDAKHYESVEPEVAAEIQKRLGERFDPKGKEYQALNLQLNQQAMVARKQLKGPQAQIENFLRIGQRDLLQDMGLINQGSGGYAAVKEHIKKLPKEIRKPIDEIAKQMKRGDRFYDYMDHLDDKTKQLLEDRPFVLKKLAVMDKMFEGSSTDGINMDFAGYQSFIKNSLQQAAFQDEREARLKEPPKPATDTTYDNTDGIPISVRTAPGPIRTSPAPEPTPPLTERRAPTPKETDSTVPGLMRIDLSPHIDRIVTTLTPMGRTLIEIRDLLKPTPSAPVTPPAPPAPPPPPVTGPGRPPYTPPPPATPSGGAGGTMSPEPSVRGFTLISRPDAAQQYVSNGVQALREQLPHAKAAVKAQMEQIQARLPESIPHGVPSIQQSIEAIRQQIPGPIQHGLQSVQIQVQHLVSDSIRQAQTAIPNAIRLGMEQGLSMPSVIPASTALLPPTAALSPMLSRVKSVMAELPTMAPSVTPDETPPPVSMPAAVDIPSTPTATASPIPAPSPAVPAAAPTWRQRLKDRQQSMQKMVRMAAGGLALMAGGVPGLAYGDTVPESFAPTAHSAMSETRNVLQDHLQQYMPSGGFSMPSMMPIPSLLPAKGLQERASSVMPSLAHSPIMSSIGSHALTAMGLPMGLPMLMGMVAKRRPVEEPEDEDDDVVAAERHDTRPSAAEEPIPDTTPSPATSRFQSMVRKLTRFKPTTALEPEPESDADTPEPPDVTPTRAKAHERVQSLVNRLIHRHRPAEPESDADTPETPTEPETPASDATPPVRKKKRKGILNVTRAIDRKVASTAVKVGLGGVRLYGKALKAIYGPPIKAVGGVLRNIAPPGAMMSTMQYPPDPETPDPAPAVKDTFWNRTMRKVVDQVSKGGDVAKTTTADILKRMVGERTQREDNQESNQIQRHISQFQVLGFLQPLIQRRKKATDASTESTPDEHTGEHKPAFNDQDKDGERDGSWKQRLKGVMRRGFQGKIAEGPAEVKYKSDKNVIDVMAEKVKGVVDKLKGGLDDLGDTVTDGMEDVLDRDKEGRHGKGKGKNGGLKAPKKKSLIGKVLEKTHGIDRAYRKGVVNTVKRVATWGADKLGWASLAARVGMSGVGAGIATGAWASMVAPVALGAGALGLVGYGAYKAYKWFTRNKASTYTKLRLAQYGLTEKDDGLNHFIFELEDYLQEEAVGYQPNGVPYLIEKKLEPEKIFEMFDVDPENEERMTRFMTWFNERFKPIFLTHLAALFSIDRKMKLADIDDLKPEQLRQYLTAAAYTNGPYHVTASPFEEPDTLRASQSYVEVAMEAAKAALSKIDKSAKTVPLKEMTAVSQTRQTLEAQGSLYADKMTDGQTTVGVRSPNTQAKKATTMTAALLTEEGASFIEAQTPEQRAKMRATAVIEPLMDDAVSALEAVRFKTYGLTIMDRTRIDTLRKLEADVGEYVTVDKKGKATFDAAIGTLLDRCGKYFGIQSWKQFGTRQSWIYWFRERFLPVYLEYVGFGFLKTGHQNIAEIERSLKDSEKYALATRISALPKVWRIEEAPWYNTYCNTDPAVVEENINFLQARAKEEAVRQERADRPKEKDAGIQPPAEKRVIEPSEYNKANRSFDPSQEGESPELLKLKDVDKERVAETREATSSPAIPRDQGPMASGDGGDAYLAVEKGDNIVDLRPSVLKNLRAMAEDFGTQTGKKIHIRSGFRTLAEQQRAYAKDPGGAAKPGHSLHEKGLAIDASPADLNEAEKLGLMRKYGFTRPVGGEDWHMEPAGIQRDIQRAKDDLAYSEQMTQASIGHGGGGYGSIKGTPMKKRNSQLALSLLEGIDEKPVAKPTETPLAADPNAAAPATDAAPTAGGTTPSAATSPTDGLMKTSTGSTGGGYGGSVDNSRGFTLATKNPTTVGGGGGSAAGWTTQDGEPESVKEAKQPTIKPVPQGKAEVIETINEAARKTGVNPNTMQVFAAQESSLNPNSNRGGRGAKGLFQFIPTTWQEQVRKLDPKFEEITPDSSPFDPKASAIMAAEYLKQNLKYIKGVVPKIGTVEAYFTHLLGAGGAKKFFTSNPDTVAIGNVPGADGGNAPLFKAGNQLLSVRASYENVKNILKNKAAQFGIKLDENASVLGGSSSPDKPTDPFDAVAGATTPTSTQAKLTAEVGVKPGDATAGTLNGKPVMSQEAANAAYTAPTPPAPDPSVTAVPTVMAPPPAALSGSDPAVDLSRRATDVAPSQNAALPGLLPSNDRRDLIASPDTLQPMASPTPGFSMNALGQSMTSVDDTLKSSLKVQQEMLDVLKTLASTLSPEQVKSLMNGLIPAAGSTAPPATDTVATPPTTSRGSIPSSAINLTRA